MPRSLRPLARAVSVALTATVVLAATLPPPAQAADPPPPTVEELTKKLDDLYRASSSHATMTMAVTTANFSRTLTIESWSIGQGDAVMIIRAPARERGTATLKTEGGLWNYAPRADRLIRIPSGMLSESWMGSHFTNDDLVREASWEDDYTTTVAWGVDAGEKVLVLTSVPKPGAPVVYSKVIQVLTADTTLPVRADYYDGKDVVRVMHFKDVKSFGGRLVPSVMELVPTDKPKERTVVTYEAMEFDAEVDKGLFTPRGLKRQAQRK